MTGILAAVLATGLFVKAEPVWVKGETQTQNSFFAYKASFKAKKGDDVRLRATAGYDYRAELNGAFAAFGPARCAPGVFRVDEWPLAAKEGANELTLLSAGYNCNNFYLPVQTPFVQAEVLVNGRVVAATGHDFAAFRTGRLRKVPRHSYQRMYSEIYRLPSAAGEALELAVQPARRYLPREWDRPDFACVPMAPLTKESTRYDEKAELTVPRFMANGPDNFIHFKVGELEENPFYEMQRTKTVSRTPLAASADGTYALKDGEGALFAADRIYGGFAGFRVLVEKPVTIYFTFEEVLQKDGSIDILRTDTEATLTWHFDAPGEYTVESFEPYGFKYARLLAKGAAAAVSAPWIRTYESPSTVRAAFRSSDKGLEKIFEAARGSYKANAVDCLNDCPNRERGGWLGDTFFTGRASQWLTGSGRNERLFLENFMLPDSFGASKRYEGLVPAVWPCDLMCRECFIPTYDMWMILEIEELVRRNGDTEFAARCRPKIEAILAWLEKYINDDGLLQHLPGWVFVEWSHANLLPYDVNYPSNMLYALALDAVARMFGRPELVEKAEDIRRRVRRYSWTGEWFCDNSIVVGACGELGQSGERTEVCQYFAFFTGTATPESHPSLYNRLMNEFGPNRVKEGRYKEIWPSNFLFGTLLRMELLSRAGRTKQMLDEIRGYFLYMAERTGTLWENQNDNASCCHGFASIGAEYLFRDILGVKTIDRATKTVLFEPPAGLVLDWCEGDVPLSETEVARLGWKNENGRPVKSVVLPDGWKEL